jgi:hypothetical protein
MGVACQRRDRRADRGSTARRESRPLTSAIAVRAEELEPVPRQRVGVDVDDRHGSDPPTAMTSTVPSRPRGRDPSLEETCSCARSSSTR